MAGRNCPLASVVRELRKQIHMLLQRRGLRGLRAIRPLRGGAPTSATAKVGAADPHAGATASAAAGKGVAENAEQVEKAADDFPSNLQCRTRVKVL